MEKTIMSTNQKYEPKLDKYIVELPKPKNGQEPSSGGLRQNGKMVVQFKNPKPYKEPSYPIINTQRDVKISQRKPSNPFMQKAKQKVLSIAWQELGEPILRSGMHRIKNEIIKRIEFHSNNSDLSLPVNKPTIIDISDEDIQVISDDKKKTN